MNPVFLETRLLDNFYAKALQSWKSQFIKYLIQRNWVIWNFFHTKVGETTCYRAMKKTGSYIHCLTACKNTRFVVSKAWNSCPFKSNGHTNFKFLVFFLILNKNFNFFASICWNFCNDFNSKFSFLPNIVPLLRTRPKPGRVS